MPPSPSSLPRLGQPSDYKNLRLPRVNLTTKMSSVSPAEKIKELFFDSLCLDSFGIQEDGYLSVCAINTYVLALPLLLLALYTIPKLFNLKDNGPSHSPLGHGRMLLIVLHTAVASYYGPAIYNVISSTLVLPAMGFAFILTFMEFNGVTIPRQPLELYYHVWSASTGYFIIKHIADHVDLRERPDILGTIAICFVSFIAGAYRNIADAIEPETAEPKKQKSE